MAKRLMCVILSVMLVVAMMPTGVVAEDTDFSGYEAITSTGGALTSGSYYLTDNVTLDSDLTIASGETVIIDLNGYTLTGTGTSSVITVNGTLTINDNSGNNSGTITGGAGTKESGSGSTYYYDGGGIYVGEGGSLTLNGGTVSGNTLTKTDYTSRGAGVYVYCAEFTMNGGEITNNTGTDTSSGAGVYVRGSSSTERSTFTLNDGLISGNSCGYGAGVDIGYAYFYMYGGTISDNTSQGGSISNSGGGGVRIVDTCYFYMYGGSISNNTTSLIGGGVLAYGNGSRFYMYGGTITGNSAKSGGGVAMSNKYTGQIAKIDDGAVYGNNATSSGADILIYNSGYTRSSLYLISADEMTADGIDFTSYAWYTDESGSRYSTSNANEYTFTTGTAITGSLSLIAASATPTYTLTYSANGGSGTVTEASAYDEGTEVEVASGDGLTLDGYTFSGWNTAEDGTGTAYSAGSTIEMTEDVTLYAQWKKISYVTGQNVEFGSYLAMGFYLPVANFDVSDGSVYTVTITQTYSDNYDDGGITKGQTRPVSYTISSDTISGLTILDYYGDCYFFEIDGINAKEMADDIVVTVKKGDTLVYTSSTTSIANYGSVYITYFPDDVDGIALVEALLNYGAAAQTYFDYNTDNPATNYIPAE